MASNSYSASADLGLGDGDSLRQQVSDNEEERKKKLLAMTRSGATDYGAMSNLASSMLLGGGLGGSRG